MDVVTTRLITQRKPAPPAVSADVVVPKPQKSTTTTTTTIDNNSNTGDNISASSSGMNDKFQCVSATTTIATSTPTHYNGLWDCVTRITKEEGLQAFFIGR